MRKAGELRPVYPMPMGPMASVSTQKPPRSAHSLRPRQRSPHPAAVLAQLASPRWRWMTLTALLVCAVTMRLGSWQLDRLAQRHAESARRSQRLTSAPVPLTGAASFAPGALPLFQAVVVKGTFEGAQDLALTNEVWDGKLGVHLLSPLLIQGSDRAVLIDRGWVPLSSEGAVDLSRYRVDGPAQVTGWVRPIEHAGTEIPAAPPAGTMAVVGAPAATDRLIPMLDARYLQGQVSAPLLSLVVVQFPPQGISPEGGTLPYPPSPASPSSPVSPPFPRLPETDLGNGVHPVAAAQWFAICAIVLVGQVMYVRRKMIEEERPPQG